MAYCTEAQVQAEFKQLDISGTTSIKSAQVAEFIAEADAEINAIIGNRYQVPVANGEALTLCRMMSRALVRERIAGVLAIKQGSPKPEQNAAHMTREDVIDLATKISKGEIQFPGATLVASEGSVNSYVATNSVERTFKRGERQW